MVDFTLTVATSLDGYIARAPDDAPQNWASAEEQALFFRDVEAADWAIMGRNTHLAADRPDRRRIVFSSQIEGWQRPSQLWLDPVGLGAQDLPDLVADVHPLGRGLILGGTRVHDWFLAERAIGRVNLTIEPVRFQSGLPLFSDSDGEEPLSALKARGFDVLSMDTLNAGGTRYIELAPRRHGNQTPL